MNALPTIALGYEEKNALRRAREEQWAPALRAIAAALAELGRFEAPSDADAAFLQTLRDAFTLRNMARFEAPYRTYDVQEAGEDLRKCTAFGTLFDAALDKLPNAGESFADAMSNALYDLTAEAVGYTYDAADCHTRIS